jgi:hypothetical protein
MRVSRANETDIQSLVALNNRYVAQGLTLPRTEEFAYAHLADYRVIRDADGNTLLGYAGILMASRHEELRPSRTGSLFLAYDLNRVKSEARAKVLQQSLYWAGWVIALALAMWLVFHFLLTRRTARLGFWAMSLSCSSRGAGERKAIRPVGATSTA